jgi:hypothetical protein
MAHYAEELMEGREDRRSNPRRRKTGARLISTVATLCFMLLAMLTRCAPTEVYGIKDSGGDRRLRKPERILVYDFAVSPEDAKPTEEEAKVGRNVADILAAELVKAIGELGIPAERARHGSRVPNGMLAIEGQFVHIDEGSRALRMLIGFGAGASEIRTLVDVYMGGPRGKTLVEEFKTKAESSKKPGFGVGMGAGAVVGAISAAGAAAGGAAGGVFESKASIEADARRTAKEVARHLAVLFARQDWIAAK